MLETSSDSRNSNSDREGPSIAAMPNSQQALRDWTHSHQGRKLIRYTTVSLISTAFSLTVLLIVFGILHLWSQVPSTVFANAAATIPSYYLNRSWAWGKTGRSHVRREIIPFWSMATIGIVVSVFGARLARYVAESNNMAHWEATLVVLAANILSFGLFWVLKLLLFNRLFHVNELNEIDDHLSIEEGAGSRKN